MGVLGGLTNSQMPVPLGSRAAPLVPERPPQVTPIGAEFPIFIAEAALAALTSFALVGSLGLPWWLPLICLAVPERKSADNTSRQGTGHWL